MNRREFLQAASATFLASALPHEEVSASAPPISVGAGKGQNIVVAEVTVHPLEAARYRLNRRGSYWARLNLDTGEYSIMEWGEPIYDQPTANWWTADHDLVPDFLKSDRYPWDPPSLTPLWNWRSAIGDVDGVGAYLGDTPRFVKAFMYRDLAAPRPGIDRPWRDRRDDCPLHWVDLDLATGAYELCAANDRIFDSPLAIGVTPEYREWEERWARESKAALR
jgi:hypothetical protein